MPNELDPSAGSSGSTPPPPVPEVKPPTPPLPATPITITVTEEEYKRYLENERELREAKAEKQRVADEKEALRIRSLAEKGDSLRALDEAQANSDKALQAERERYATLQSQILSRSLETVLANGLTGVEWADPTMGPTFAKDHLKDRFEASFDQAGNVQVLDKQTRQPASEAIKTWLTSAQSAVLRKASSQGGAGGGGHNPPPPALTNPRFDEVLVASMKAQYAAAPPNSHGIGRPAKIMTTR